MKAIVQNGYGSPDVLDLQDVEPPQIGDEGVLVEVHAASVNALDWHITRGMPYVVRLSEGSRTPRQQVRGIDVAGRVAAVGAHVSRLHVGDLVFGGADGSFAEFAVTTESRVVRKPAGITCEQAASFHIAGMTALQGLRDRAQVRAGQRVLINGAGGGVGAYAVQIAKTLGAHVTASTRTEHLDLVHTLGADDVVDYRREDVTRRGHRYDAIFDISGRHPLNALRRALAPDGAIVVVGGPAGRWLAPATRMAHAALLSRVAGQRILPFLSRNDHPTLEALAELSNTGRLRPVIDRSFPLADTAEAVGYVGTGSARGKVVIAVR